MEAMSFINSYVVMWHEVHKRFIVPMLNQHEKMNLTINNLKTK